MANLNIKAQQENSYDAIVVGSGMSGGWAAKELCEKGLKTLVLERGRMVKHVEDYPTMNKDPWDFQYRGAVTPEQYERQFKQQRTGFLSEADRHFFVDDIDNPYTEIKRFDWIRGYHTGGRSLMWGRHCYRWSDLDFEANAKDGIAVDWPIRYKDIEPWYDYVETYVGVSGEKLNLSQLPDGKFLPPMELNCIEKHVRSRIESAFSGRTLTIGRVAHLTEPTEAHLASGRNKCQYRNRCSRGCPYTAYFSSNGVTLPAAERTGNMTLRPHSIVHSIIYDNEQGRATGVRIIDEETMENIEYYAPVIFCNASALGTTQILLNSTSDRFPNGLGNDSGELGHNLMDHHYKVGAYATYDGFEDQYYKGRRPTGPYIPRYRNLDPAKEKLPFLRGYGYQGDSGRENWGRGVNEPEIGKDFKDNLFKPGPWSLSLVGFGEHLPYHDNKVMLNHDLKDKWGLPTLSIDCEYKENELTMRKHMAADAAEMLEAAGMKNVQTYDNIGAPGKGIHEMGTARMGKDPKTSVLNKHNQLHAVPNVYVTDGACMTSASCVNPSISYMALTARAVDHAVSEMKKQNIKA
ncbi:MAG: GMC family oxidoreductase [Cyclobacteriaceae bacterium]